MWDEGKTHIARLAPFPCGWPFPSPPVFGVVLGGRSGSVALYARKVANMYPGSVELPLLLRVLLITENDSLRRCALKLPYRSRSI